MEEETELKAFYSVDNLECLQRRLLDVEHEFYVEVKSRSEERLARPVGAEGWLRFREAEQRVIT